MDTGEDEGREAVDGTGEGREAVDTGKAVGCKVCTEFVLGCERLHVRRSICSIAPFKTETTWLIGFSAILKVKEEFSNYSNYTNYLKIIIIN